MKDISKEYFIKNREKQNAVIREIEIIGEAVKNISNNLREKYPSIPWKDIVGTRDKMIHHYFGVDPNVILRIIREDIPVLKNQIQKIRIGLEDESAKKEKQEESRKDKKEKEDKKK